MVNSHGAILKKFFIAEITVLKKNDGGKNVPIFDHYYSTIRFNRTGIIRNALIDFDRDEPQSVFTPTGSERPIDIMLIPGNSGKVKVVLDSPALVVPGLEFDVTEGKSILVAKGIVIDT